MPDEGPIDDPWANRIDDVARAVVRPTVTILFAAAFIFFTWLGYVSGEVFSSVAGMIFAFWFSSRNQEKSDLATAATVSQAIQASMPLPESRPSTTADRQRG